jgi:hypothetical protein
MDVVAVVNGMVFVYSGYGQRAAYREIRARVFRGWNVTRTT